MDRSKFAENFQACFRYGIPQQAPLLRTDEAHRPKIYDELKAGLCRYSKPKSEIVVVSDPAGLGGAANPP
jgi:hypothetical protein